MSRPDAATGRLVRQRGAGRCEYCRFPESRAELPFQLDHITALQHLGPTTEANLAFACYHCNSAKGPNIVGIDPVSGLVSPLYHPRHDAWPEHLRYANDSPGPGNAILLVTRFANITEISSGIAQMGKSSEAVGVGAAKGLKSYLASNAPVGVHLAD